MIIRRILPFLLSFIFADAATSAEILTGKTESSIAHEICLNPTADLRAWAMNGHLHGSYYLALIAGADPERAFRIAYYSQYPDIDIRFDAVSVAIEYKLKLWNPWRSSVMEKLHSLHGKSGDKIDSRRNRLYGLLQKSLPNPELDYYSGIVLHALGDSYAHTKYAVGSDKESAYGPMLGHALASIFGNDPDNILHDGPKEKYIQFVNDFNARLSNTTTIDADPLYDVEDWELIVDEIPEYAEPFDTLISAVEESCLGEKSTADSTCTDDLASWGDFSISKANAVENYMICMNDESKPLSKELVSNILSDI